MGQRAIMKHRSTLDTNGAEAEPLSRRPKGRNFGLDFARAIAIALVVVAHYCGPLNRLGIFGVELFFGLSGYLIGGILIRTLLGPEPVTSTQIFVFWQRRWWRTLPNYFLFLGLAFFFPPPNAVAPKGIDAAAFFVFSQNVSQAGQSFFGVSWSLCIEEWFYLLFPVAIVGATKCGIDRRHIVTATVLLSAILCVLFRTHLVQEGRTALEIRMLTFGRLDAIGFGVLVASVAHNNFFSSQAKSALALAGSMMVCLSTLAYPYEQTSQIWSNLGTTLPPLGFAMILPWIETVDFKRFPLFVRTTIRHLSLWSYSIYLAHIPLLHVAYLVAGEHRSHFHVNLACRLAALTGTIVSSAIIFRYFESRITELRPPESCSSVSKKAR